MAKQRVLIAVKTYPTLSEKYRELACTAGFREDGSWIRLYTLASTLVSIADALKEANAIVNPGYQIEIVVEALGKGSFRAKIRTIYSGLNNLFSKDDLKNVALGVLASFIFQHTLFDLQGDFNQVVVTEWLDEIMPMAVGVLENMLRRNVKT